MLLFRDFAETSGYRSPIFFEPPQVATAEPPMSGIEVRLAALEYVVAITAAQLYSVAGLLPEEADKLRQQVHERLSERSLTKLADPALSDVRSAEIAEAIDRLLTAAIAVLRKTSSGQP